MLAWGSLLFSGLAAAEVVARATPDYDSLDKCPGYAASNVQTTDNGLTADLKLAGTACNTYGDDLEDLVLEVTYENGECPPAEFCLATKMLTLYTREPPPRQDPGQGEPGLPDP